MAARMATRRCHWFLLLHLLQYVGKLVMSMAQSSDISVLLAFKGDLTGGANSLSDWTMSAFLPCGWTGVSCDGSGRGVTGLNLSNTNLSGPLSSELSKLTGLRTLNLSFNSFNGSIPGEIGNLKQLNYLDLSKNQLTGDIPAELCDLSMVKYINISDNYLQGRIPSGGTCNNLSATSFLQMLVSAVLLYCPVLHLLQGLVTVS